MPPDTAYPDALNKPEPKPNFRSIGWKDLMSDFLMGTDICNTEIEKEKNLNPNVVMDMRHKMVKRHPNLKNNFSQEQIHTKALELIRTQNQDKLRKRREGKLVEKEIAKLKEALESRRLLTTKSLEETPKKNPKRSSSSKSAPIFPKHFTKLCKSLEWHNGTHEVNTWNSQSIQMTMETKISPQGIPFDVKVSLQRQEFIEECLEQISTRKGSIIDDEIELGNHIWKEYEGKNEIMKRFFESGLTEVKPEAQVDVKNNTKMRGIHDIQNKINQRRVEHAWETWKAYIDQLRNRRKEKTIYKEKIEMFLSKLQEREVEMKKKNLKRPLSRKEEIMKNLYEKTIINKKLNNERDEEKLQKLVQEIKESRTEAVNKLREITKTNNEIQKKYENVKFLQRMEERKEERIKRRNEIQERRRILEEKKENERKQKEEEQKRKKLEELKEKRKLEKEKMEEQKREREKLKLNISLADSHYRKYLLRRWGLGPWIMLMKRGDLLQQKAVTFFERSLTQNTFSTWANNIREERVLKERCADEFYERLLKKNYLQIWMRFYKERVEQIQVAVDWDEFKTTERTFKEWLRFTLNERLENLNKDNIAILKYEQKLKMKCLKKMRDYPELKKLEQAKENRKRKWRQKVKEILPDFQPTEIFEYS